MLKINLAAVLALGIAGAISPALGEPPIAGSPVTGLRMVGPDLEVFVSASPEEGATVVLLDAAGAWLASAPVSAEGSALLAGALAAVPGHGPAYRVILANDDGAMGEPFPFLVALRCPPEGACRFQLLPGLEAPGAALVDPALGRALDALGPETPDLLEAAEAGDPALRGAALTAAWTWSGPGKIPPGTCGCVWTLEAALPGDTAGGGVVVGLMAREAQGEEAVRLERARVSSLALRQRCVRADTGPARAVTVADGAWSTLLQVPRIVLANCPEACSPAVSWEAEVEGRVRAWAEGGEGSAAHASWQAEVVVDGALALQIEDGSAIWSGPGTAVALRAAARAEIAAPEGPTDAEAVAAVAWRLAGEGVSACAAPGRVGITAVSPLRIGFNLEIPGRPCDPGQIGLLTGPGTEGGCRP